MEIGLQKLIDLVADVVRGRGPQRLYLRCTTGTPSKMYIRHWTSTENSRRLNEPHCIICSWSSGQKIFQHPARTFPSTLCFGISAARTNPTTSSRGPIHLGTRISASPVKVRTRTFLQWLFQVVMRFPMLILSYFIGVHMACAALRSLFRHESCCEAFAKMQGFVQVGLSVTTF